MGSWAWRDSIRFDTYINCAMCFHCVSPSEWMAACDKSILIKIHLGEHTHTNSVGSDPQHRPRWWRWREGSALISTFVCFHFDLLLCDWQLLQLRCATQNYDTHTVRFSTVSEITYFTLRTEWPNMRNQHVASWEMLVDCDMDSNGMH